MMLNPATKLFVQLQPDKTGIASLQQLQAALPCPQTNLVPATTLHLTVLHIGVLYKMLGSLKKQAGVNRDSALDNTVRLVQDLETAIRNHGFETITLSPNSVDYFGSQHDTLVLTFMNSPELMALHTASLQALRLYFERCGVSDVDTFMRHDSNFSHALGLRPHVTLAKACTGSIATSLPPAVTFSIMPVVYEH